MKSWGGKKKGVILISVLWILAILSLLALSLSRSSSLELQLAKHSIGRMHAYAAARAGVAYARQLLAHRRASQDSLAHCGIDIKDKKAEDYFKAVKVGEAAHVDIVYKAKSDGIVAVTQAHYGLMDEERKININALRDENFRVLSVLLQQVAGVDKSSADNMASSVVDWRDEDSTALKDPQGNAQGAESDYYAALKVPYKAKNKPFDCIEELMMVKGITSTIFKKIKPYITVFPTLPTTGMQVNLLTAPEAVLKALLGDLQARQVIPDAQAAFQSVMDHRKAGQVQNADSPAEQSYHSVLAAANGSETSQFFRVRAVGVDEASGIKAVVEVVVLAEANSDAGAGAVTYKAWHRD